MQKTRWKWQWLLIFVVNPFSSLFIRTGLVTKECAKLYNHHRHLPSCKYFFSLVCMRALAKHTQSLHTAANALHTFTKTTETLLIFYLIKFQFGCKYVLLAYYYRATTIILPLNVKRMVVLIFFQLTSSSSLSLLSIWCWWHACSHFHRFPEYFFTWCHFHS